QAFRSRRFLAFLRRRSLAVHNVDAAALDSRTAVARADWLPPEHARSAAWELVQDAGLAPDAVALRAHPLRPIVRPRRGAGREEEEGANPFRPRAGVLP